MSSALTDADQDAGLREEPPLHSFCINPVGGQNIRAEGTYRFTTEAEAFAYAEWARSTIAILRSRATAAEDKLRDREAEIKRLRGALEGILPGKLCGESWGLPDTERMPIQTTLGALTAARAALASTEPHARSEEATDAR